MHCALQPVYRSTTVAERIYRRDITAKIDCERFNEKERKRKYKKKSNQRKSLTMNLQICSNHIQTLINTLIHKYSD